MIGYERIQNEVIKEYRVKINAESTCWRRVHAHVKERKVCKWKRANSILSTFTLFHEIGHIETTTGSMRRCESEYYATVWALEKCAEYGLEVPAYLIDKYQKYIYMELDRGIRRGGRGYPTREQMNLRRARA